MTDRAQFEAMLEALINEDQESAKEIFHNIVVSKSREIYEELLAEDFTEDQNATSGQGGDDMPMGEMFGDEEGSEDDSEEPADDAEDDAEDDGDDAEDDGEENPFGDEGGEEGEGDMEDRVMDLEDALEELKAEFEQLMSGEEGEEHMGGDDMGGMDAMGGDDMGGMGAPEEELEGQLFEYVNKVSVPKGGDNGTNTKSVIDNMKNDMGGTTANIAKSFSTEKGGTQGGLLKPTTQPQDGGNINKPGANAGKTAFKKKEPGHGAEKAGAKETADNKQSLLRQAKR
jgi:hypothetical protein